MINTDGAKAFSDMLGDKNTPEATRQHIAKVMSSDEGKPLIEALDRSANELPTRTRSEAYSDKQKLVRENRKVATLKDFYKKMQNGPTDILSLRNDKDFMKQSGITEKDFKTLEEDFYKEHGYKPNSFAHRLASAGRDVGDMSTAILAKAASGALWAAELPQDAVMNTKDLITGVDNYDSSKDAFGVGTRKFLDTGAKTITDGMSDRGSYSKEVLDNMSTVGSIAIPGLPYVNSVTSLASKAVPGSAKAKKYIEVLNNSKTSRKVLDRADRAVTNLANDAKNIASYLSSKSSSPLVLKFNKMLKDNVRKQTSINQMGRGFVSQKETKKAIKKAIKDLTNNKDWNTLSQADLSVVRKIIDRQVNSQSKGFSRYKKSNTSQSTIQSKEDILRILDDL